MDPILAQFEGLVEQIRKNNRGANLERVREAFRYADAQHAGQVRKSGEPYITHPLHVASIVAELELDTDSIVAALLHDCIEDTGSTHEDIAKLFGETVAGLVEGVTKLTRVQYVTKEEEQMENLRKMLMAMSQDVRVILIKICDRLHNMRTLQFQPPKKQREKALETMEIYAPIAHRLGMQRVKWELEDLALQYLDPIGYKEIEQDLAAKSSAHEEFMASVQKRINDRLAAEGINATAYGRVKHIYSIYRKMYTQNKTMDEIFDLYAFRVIVDDIPNCYNVLGCIHDLFKPVLGRFKDYIGTPKPNGYQSLHTTVIGREGIPFEVQIRTQEMHHTAEYGVAAHWKYKQGLANGSLGSEETFEWVRKLLESQQDTDAEEFVRSLKVDLFADEVFVFTPQGDVKSLPAGANPIDFAYSIHSAIGNKMTGAKINGRIVPFDTPLQNGDIVEIITSKNAHGPSRGWVKLCKSNEARNKIRQWFKKERREENIATGKVMLENELRRLGIPVADVVSEENLPHILKKVGSGSWDDLCAAIGYGGMTAVKAGGRIKDELARLGKLQGAKAPAPLPQQGGMIYPGGVGGGGNIPGLQKAPKHTESGIVVEGLGNCMVKFAKCCTPVPGDPVIGFITRGYGVSVHRADCPNAQFDHTDAQVAGRWVNVAWVEGDLESYRTALELTAVDRDGLALDVATVLSTLKVKVSGLSARSMEDATAVVMVELEVKDKTQLQQVTHKLGQIHGVSTVKRVTG